MNDIGVVQTVVEVLLIKSRHHQGRESRHDDVDHLTAASGHPSSEYGEPGDRPFFSGFQVVQGDFPLFPPQLEHIQGGRNQSLSLSTTINASTIT